MEKDLSARLVKGAGVLGRIFREREMAPCGWNAMCHCTPPDTKRWCAAKARWMGLVAGSDRFLQEANVTSNGAFSLLEIMTVAEIEATGVTVVVEMPEGKIEVGPDGQISWGHMVALTQNVEEAKSLFRIMGGFKGSVVAIEEGKPDGKKG